MKVISESRIVLRYTGKVKCPNCKFEAYLTNNEMEALGPIDVRRSQKLNGVCMKCAARAEFTALSPRRCFTEEVARG
jgi:ribosomal protein L40E